MLLLCTRVLLSRRGTTATLRLLTRRITGRASESEPRAALRAVRRAGRVLGGACLVQSVALTAVLERGDQHPTLVLGCRPQDGQLWTAHAWVIVGGEVLEPVRGQAHAELARLNASNQWVPSPADRRS